MIVYSLARMCNHLPCGRRCNSPNLIRRTLDRHDFDSDGVIRNVIFEYDDATDDVDNDVTEYSQNVPHTMDDYTSLPPQNLPMDTYTNSYATNITPTHFSRNNVNVS